MKRKVFISFASRDRKVASSICDALEARGHTGWMSSRDVQPGENYQGAIVRAIRDAGVMVLIFSANANNSDEIKKELAVASQQKLMVIPVRAEDVVPSEDYIYELATRQWIDLFDDWEHALDRLARQIDVVIPRDAQTDPPPPAQPPILQGARDLPRKDPVADGGEKRGAGYWIMGGAAVLLLLGAGAWALYSRQSANPPAPAQVAQSAPTTANAVAPANPPAATSPVEAPPNPQLPANEPKPAAPRRIPPARDAVAIEAPKAQTALAPPPKSDLAQAGKNIVAEIDRVPNVVLRFRIQMSGKDVTAVRSYSNVRFDLPNCAILFHDKNDMIGYPTSEAEKSVDLHNITAFETYSSAQSPASAKLTMLQDAWFIYIPARGARYSTPASFGMSFPDQATASRVGEMAVAASALCGKT